MVNSKFPVAVPDTKFLLEDPITVLAAVPQTNPLSVKALLSTFVMVVGVKTVLHTF